MSYLYQHLGSIFPFFVSTRCCLNMHFPYLEVSITMKCSQLTTTKKYPFRVNPRSPLPLGVDFQIYCICIICVHVHLFFLHIFLKLFSVSSFCSFQIRDGQGGTKHVSGKLIPGKILEIAIRVLSYQNLLWNCFLFPASAVWHIVGVNFRIKVENCFQIIFVFPAAWHFVGVDFWIHYIWSYVNI